MAGVRWHKAAKKWVAELHMEGKSHYLGSFDGELRDSDRLHVCCR
jgi:hypothetical protein